MDINTLTETTANTYVARAIDDLAGTGLADDDFLIAIQEEFDSWNANAFDLIGSAWKRELKLFIRERGVYLGPFNGKTTPQLARMISLETCPLWDDQELAKQRSSRPHNSSPNENDDQPLLKSWSADQHYQLLCQ